MNSIESSFPVDSRSQRSASLTAARAACARIAPLWPLQHFVAVNPFLGVSNKPFTEVCELMHQMVPGGMQMPPSYYLGKKVNGTLQEEDLAAALELAIKVLPPDQAEQVSCWTPQRILEELEQNSTVSKATVLSAAEGVDRHYGTSWSSAITESIALFCASYFDAGQSAWRLPWKELPLYQAWREYAWLDASLELQGLKGFRSHVKVLPADAESALEQLLGCLNIEDNLTDFLHKQLFTIRGWAGYVQYLARGNGIQGRADDLLLQLLVIRLAHDAALLSQFDSPTFREFWPNHRETHLPLTLALFVCQLADERIWQRQLSEKLRRANSQATWTATGRPAVQAAFCIDVRSEVFRRALEATSPGVQTLGFAGFFGLPIASVPFGQKQAVAQCPVLLTPKYRVGEMLRRAGAEENETALRQARLGRRLTYSWNSFKGSAISCFSFVETAGLAFGVKLFRDAFVPGSPALRQAERYQPQIEPDEHGLGGIPLTDQVTLGRGALRNMGLTRNFARLVLLCGHGSATTNNPYAAGLDCGACGGHSGEINARVGAAILNNPTVRAALAAEGIVIPTDTLFLAGLHNTTTDEVTLFDVDLVAPTHRTEVAELQAQLKVASRHARRERAHSLGLESTEEHLDRYITARSLDWSQVRPEWGLAGNAAFIAAPRSRTLGVNLNGRVFLHDYDHRTDSNNSILELIMCAPMVVANWINLQYYASSVNNPVFGSGNKVVQHIVGTLGVCLGNGGDLQTGLPFQSVHDGVRLMHEPLRLHVIVEAPHERIDAVLAKHEGVRQLVENGWLLLFALTDEIGRLHRYLPGGTWERLS